MNRPVRLWRSLRGTIHVAAPWNEYSTRCGIPNVFDADLEEVPGGLEQVTCRRCLKLLASDSRAHDAAQDGLNTEPAE